MSGRAPPTGGSSSKEWPETDKEHLRQVLMLIQRDHYVVQQPDGAYRFRFPIIQRHWQLHRGLLPES